jgi:hypothetical protein
MSGENAAEQRGDASTSSEKQPVGPPSWNWAWLTPPALAGVIALILDQGPYAAVLIALSAFVIVRVVDYGHSRTPWRALLGDRPTVGLLLLLVGLAAIYPITTSQSSKVRPQPSSLAAALKQVSLLSANEQIESFVSVLGAPPIKNDRGSFIESIWKKRFFFVQAISTPSGKVAAYSVTTRSTRFHPVYPVCIPFEDNPHVALTGDFPRPSMGGPGVVYGIYTSYDQVYSEIYGGYGYCGYVRQVLSFNGNGFGTQSAGNSEIYELSKYAPAGADSYTAGDGSTDGSGAGRTVASDFADKRFVDLRRKIRVNTITITYPDPSDSLFMELSQPLFGEHPSVTFGPRGLDAQSVPTG